jgi:hypothetical protein
VAIFDLESMHAKTGIAHRRLKPTLALVDPENTKCGRDQQQQLPSLIFLTGTCRPLLWLPLALMFFAILSRVSLQSLMVRCISLLKVAARLLFCGRLSSAS